MSGIEHKGNAWDKILPCQVGAPHLVMVVMLTSMTRLLISTLTCEQLSPPIAQRLTKY
jgi:hypothetical protein